MFKAVTRTAMAAIALCAVACALTWTVPTGYPACTAEPAYANQKPAKAKIASVKQRAAKKTTQCKVTVSVKRAKHAKRYQYQLSDDPKFRWAFRKATTKSRTYTFDKMPSGWKYYVRVRAVNGKKAGAWSAKRAFFAVLTAPKLTSVNVEKKLATCSDVDADRYRFQFSATKAFKKVSKTVVSKCKPKVSLASVKAGTTAWLRVRGEGSYKEVCSRWSVPRKVTMPAAKPAAGSTTASPTAVTAQLGETVTSPETGYRYSFHVLNDGPLYTDTPIVVYVKTNNPADFHFLMSDRSDFKRAGKAYSDIKYTNETYLKVEGGFVLGFTLSKTGTAKTYLEDDPSVSFTVDVTKDTEAEKKKWFQSLVDKYASGKTSTADKLRAVGMFLNCEFDYMYIGYDANGAYKNNTETYPGQLTPMRFYTCKPWMGKRTVGTCTTLCIYMQMLAEYLGVPSDDIKITALNGLYGHYRIDIVADGEKLGFGTFGPDTKCELDCRPGHDDYVDLSKY